MNEATLPLPSRLQEIVTDFSYCVGREKLEYLLEFAENMPTLPGDLAIAKDVDHQVHECMTPVFVYVKKQAGKLRFYFDVPEEAPTVRGFASLMHQGLLDVTPQQLLAIPDDFFLAMGLHTVLSGQRLNGLGGILRYVKRLTRELESTGEGPKG